MKVCTCAILKVNNLLDFILKINPKGLVRYYLVQKTTKTFCSGEIIFVGLLFKHCSKNQTRVNCN